MTYTTAPGEVRAGLAEDLQWMAGAGSSLSLTYGEDGTATGRWECSWVIDGRRFTATGERPQDAVRQALDAGWRAGALDVEEAQR
jgi:hypothetical protein